MYDYASGGLLSYESWIYLLYIVRKAWDALHVLFHVLHISPRPDREATPGGGDDRQATENGRGVCRWRESADVELCDVLSLLKLTESVSAVFQTTKTYSWIRRPRRDAGVSCLSIHLCWRSLPTHCTPLRRDGVNSGSKDAGTWIKHDTLSSSYVEYMCPISTTDTYLSTQKGRHRASLHTSAFAGPPQGSPKYNSLPHNHRRHTYATRKLQTRIHPRSRWALLVKI